MSNDVVAIAITPPHVVTSSMSRGIAGLARRLSQRGSQWMVYDVGLDGLSLVSNYRSHFNSITRPSSVAHLLEGMRTERSRGLAAGLLLGFAATSYARWR